MPFDRKRTRLSVQAALPREVQFLTKRIVEMLRRAYNDGFNDCGENERERQDRLSTEIFRMRDQISNLQNDVARLTSDKAAVARELETAYRFTHDLLGRHLTSPVQFVGSRVDGEMRKL